MVFLGLRESSSPFLHFFAHLGIEIPFKVSQVFVYPCVGNARDTHLAKLLDFSTPLCIHQIILSLKPRAWSVVVEER